ncbi:uncharacterized protein [Scyliorhinus torazame]|uniref:uncharacterized protein n=1 Tax=Scyliorhinus torazame TaxID=75743 RepID=UPI003B5AB6F8
MIFCPANCQRHKKLSGHSTSQQSKSLSNTQHLDKNWDWRLGNRETTMLMLVLIVMFYFHTGIHGESQELASDDRTPPPSPALLSYLQTLKQADMERLDREVKNVLKSRLISTSGSAGDSLDIKTEDVEESINDSTELKGGVKRYQHNLRRQSQPPSRPRTCHLGLCRTLSLAHRLYELNNIAGKDPSPPKSTDDPYGYGKRRRRSLLYLLGLVTRPHKDGQAEKQ